MAYQTTRKVTVAQFRVLVVLAFVMHAVVLFVLPRMQFLFSPDVLELMRHGGHGATVAMNHPVILALYLLPFPAFVGLLLLQAWGKYLLLAFCVLTVAGSFFFGATISGPPEEFFSTLAWLFDGAILGLAFLSSPSSEPKPSNPLMQPTGRERPSAD